MHTHTHTKIEIRFNKNVAELAVFEHRAQLDKYTNWPLFIIHWPILSLPLYSFMLIPLQSTLTSLPFPSFGPSAKHPIVSLTCFHKISDGKFYDP